MADSINTGAGGFEIDGNQELFDVGLPEPTNPAQPYGPRPPGVDVSAAFNDANGKPKDLTNVTKTTLAQYLSKVTRGQEGSSPVANDYPIDSGLVTITTTKSDGTPSVQSPGAPPPANSTAFAPKVSDFSSLSDNYSKISPALKKGKASFNAIDGNDLLPGIPGDSGFTAEIDSQRGTSAVNPQPVAGHNSTAAVIKPYISAVLSSNRFALAGTNASQQAFSDAPSGPAGFNPGFTQQTKLGTYDPLAPTVTPGRLAAIGALLTMRAGKELGASSPGADPNSAALQAGALLPGLAQLGVTQVDPNMLLASDILANLTTDELGASNVFSIANGSWGQLNNTDDPFSGTDALGMLALSTALVAGVELLFDGLDLLLGMITPATKAPTRDNQGRYTLGEYFQGTRSGTKAASGGIGGALSALTSLNFGALLGIQPTSFPFKQALSTGTNAFFGIPDNSGVLGQLVGAVASSTDSPGFNVVIARAIIRSGTTIVAQLKKIGGNVLNAITQVLAFIDTIKSSKIVAACNVFAQLGDAILSDPARWADPDQPNKTSAMDSYSNDLPDAVISKNRLQGTLKLAWASNRAAANLLLPASILGLDAALNATKGFGSFSPFFGVGGDGYSKVQSTLTNAANAGRIDPVTAASFEDQLESAYVPFYFHDLRTNEMVAFHAFLASLSDDYSAGYDKSEGFGRVEPVKIYKGTERRINMSFYVAATSLADFDDMWVKLNKLVTLVYPQYTQGVQLSSADGSTYKITQPFSQLLGASPLIRIRLGDLLRSNYSQFALGRLFGMGNQDFQVGTNGPFTGADSLTQGDVDNLAQALQTAQNNPSSELYTPAPGTWPLFDGSGGGPLGGLSVPAPPLPGGLGGSSTPQFASQFKSSDAHFFEVKAVQLFPDNPTLIVGQVQFRTDAAFQQYFSVNQAALTDKFDNPDDPTTRYIGGQYVFPITALSMTDASESSVVAKLSTLTGVISSNTGFVNDVTAFLDPIKNAVAKSFSDTAGKGLAGVIESMSFDWMDKSTWETQDGRIAPKLCKVNIQFSPIHDISPGIDHLGFNRAPIYPVGVLGSR
jgi:hypothetical protein